MNNNFIYLDDIQYEGKGKFTKTPAGIKYNCFKCKKIIETQPYGSYKYCLRCFNTWKKHQGMEKTINNSNEFID